MQIAGYRELTVLGRGGFSTVYRAVQESVHRDVALKVLSVHMAGADAKARFQRECATNGRVGTHPNIVTLFDSGFADDGSPFLAMQLCAGGSLAQRVRAAGPLPVADVLRIGVKIAAALHYAHSAGVLHRDIKPENILITEFGEPELADFGISSVDDQRMSTVTASSLTINHAAPEALAGHPTSISTDVYSLCSTLFTVLAGRTPFQSPNSTAIFALVNQVMNEPAPATGRADVPPSLERLLAAGLAKTPAARPPDARALGTALQDIQRELGLPVTEFPSAPPPVASSPTQTLGAPAADARLSGPPVFGVVDTGALPPTGAMPGPTGSLRGSGTSNRAPTGDWGAWAGDQAQVRPPAGTPDRSLPPPVPPPPAPWVDDRPDRRAWWIAAVVLLVVLVAGGVYLVARSTNGKSTATPPATSSARAPSTTRQSPPATTSARSTAHSTPSGTRSSSRTSPTTLPAAAVPVIEEFGSSSVPNGGSVACASTVSSVNVPLVWASSAATTAWLGIDSPGGDAAKAPFESDVPPSAQGRTLPFACSADQHTFTLTVKGAGGQFVSRSVTYHRSLPATSSPQTSSSTATTSPKTTTSPPVTTTSTSTPATPSTSTTPTTSKSTPTTS